MKVFISWSGELSREIGQVFRDWLPDVLQFVEPFFTPNDVEKGKRWATEIASHLGESKIGLVCLTAQNLEAPWLLFEAGAISKYEDSHLCPMLFGIDDSQLKGPLAQFQATQYSRDEIYKFVIAINGAAGEKSLSQAKVSNAFDKWWPELDQKIVALLSRPISTTAPKPRPTTDMVEEILGIVRTINQSASIPDLPHWVLHFTMVLDFADDFLKLTAKSEQFVVLELMKHLLAYTKNSLNLMSPRISKNSKPATWEKLHKRGTDTLEALEARIFELDDEIPF